MPAAENESAAEAAPYAALFSHQFASMVHLARLLGADDPENVAQEAFVRLESRTRRLRDQNASIAYVRATVVNLSRSRIRHLVVARRAAPWLVQPDVVSSEQSVVERDEHARVRMCLARIPRRQREVLVLRYWLDLTEADIAQTLGLSNGAVKAYASRGLDAIEKQMRQS